MLKKYVFLAYASLLIGSSNLGAQTMEKVYQNAIATDLSVQAFDSGKRVFTTKIRVGSNSCTAIGLSASLEMEIDEKTEQIMIRPVVIGERDKSKLCIAVYDPVYQEVSLAFSIDMIINQKIIVQNVDFAGGMKDLSELI